MPRSAPGGGLAALGGAPARFGIVAAALGVVNTMPGSGSAQPPAVLGGGLSAPALVGTFLGILLAYAFAEPPAGLLEQGRGRRQGVQCIKTPPLLASMQGYAPCRSPHRGWPQNFSGCCWPPELEVFVKKKTWCRYSSQAAHAANAPAAVPSNWLCLATACPWGGRRPSGQ